jgi:hypothetical protein
MLKQTFVSAGDTFYDVFSRLLALISYMHIFHAHTTVSIESVIPHVKSPLCALCLRGRLFYLPTRSREEPDS